MTLHPRHLAPVAAVALAFTLASCGTAKEAAEKANAGSGSDSSCPWKPDTSVDGTVRVGYQVLPSGDLIVRDKGLLEACMPNATIKWSQYSSGGDVVQAFGSRSLDIGVVGSSPAVQALSAPLDIDLKVVWIQDVIGEAEELVAKSGIKDVAALKGKKIGVPFGSTAHFSLVAALKDAGLDPQRDADIINLEPDAILGAWKRGEIDAAYVWDPTLSELKADGTVLKSGKDVSKMGAPTFDLSAATTSFIKANPAFMAQWTRAEDYAVKMIHDDPATAAESLSVQMGSDVKTVEKQLSGTTYLDAADQLKQYFGNSELGSVLYDTAGFLADQGDVDAASAKQHYVDALDSTAMAAVAKDGGQ